MCEESLVSLMGNPLLGESIGNTYIYIYTHTYFSYVPEESSLNLGMI